MAVSSQLIGVKGDECQCGRRQSIRHCPACGSTRVYARLNKYHKCLDGELRFVENEFRCQTCGHLFIEEEREFCEAPPVGAKLAAQKVKALHEANVTGEHLRPKDKRLADALKVITEKEGIQVTQSQGTSPLSETDLKNVWFAYRRAWIDTRIEKPNDTPPLLEYLARGLKEHGLAQEHIDVILQWQREETQAAEASTS